MISTIICASATVCALVTSLPSFDQVQAQRMGMGREQELKLQQDCEAMNSEGRIRDLLVDLNRNALELSSLRFEKYEDRNFYRIRQLKENIRQITQKAKSILRPEWTDNRWPYKATWQLRFADVMPIDPRVIPSNFAFSDFELDGVSLGGIEREDLYPLVHVTTKSQAIQVEIEKSASSLELCQLQSTWVIEGTVRYKFQNADFAHSSNLSLRPGVIQPPEPKVPSPPDLIPVVEKPSWTIICRGPIECGWERRTKEPKKPWSLPGEGLR